MRLIYKYLFAIVVTILSVSATHAQYTVEANILLNPPYPTNFDAYVDYLEEGIIEIVNLENVEQDVFFELEFFETSGLLRVSTDGMLTDAITLQPGVNVLSPMDIQNAFSGLTEENFITAGLSQTQLDNIQLNRQLPEGNYRLCLKAFNANGQQISDPALGCTDFEIIFAERPIILGPFDGEEVDTSGFLFVTWDHNINDAMIQNRLEYTLKIIDITEQAVQNIELAMLDPGLSPEYEEVVGSVNNANLLDDVELPLIVGHQYAIRVTAVDPEEGLGFQFGGHSEIVVFWYGVDIEVEEEEEEDAFEMLAAPVLVSPESGFLADDADTLSINLTWSHEVDDSLAVLLSYEFKVIDMDTQKVTSISLEDFEDDNYDYLWNDGIVAKDTTLKNDIGTALVKDHKYAIAIKVSSEDDRITFENDGYTELVTFIFGEEEEEEDDEEACGGYCLAELPTDQVESPILKGETYFMGKLSLTVDQVLKDSDGGYKGEGYVAINFFKQVKINVEFEGLKANKSKRVFEGEANAIFDENTVKADGLVAFGASSALDIDFEKAKALTSALRSGGKMFAAFAGKRSSLPLGFNREEDGDNMIVGVTEMNFTPEKASLTALFSLENPEWGDYVPTLGATDICFSNNGFGEVVRLFLGEDYNIPLSNEQLILKASENNTDEEKGTFCLIDCDGFKKGQITAEIGVPREVLLPENEEGEVEPDGFAKLTLSGTFYKSNGFMLSASMSPAQIPGLEGFSFTMENGYYDSSDELTPERLKCPPGYTRQETDKLWKGVWFNNVSLKAPKDWGFANEEDRTEIAINDLIKDDTGLSVVASAKNVLGIEKGEIEGFAISIDELKLDIIRGEFKEVKMSGKLGLPILPEDSYLDYEGIVDRNKKEDGKENTGTNAVAGESLAMSFIVKPDEEGYDMDWIKSHIDFDESSQFILENNNKRRGFSATLTGDISIKGNGLDASNASRDDGMPEIDIPGLKFEGMEISRMIDKSGKEGTNTGKNNSGGFVFKRPTMSFHGTSFNNLTGGTVAENFENPEAEDEEEDEEKEPKMNGFSLTLSDVAFQFGEGDESEEKEITEGSALQLMVKPNISLVGRQGQKNKAGKDKGFAITAEGKFTIDALVRKNGNKMTFDYKSLSMDSLGVESEIGPIEINGSLGFYNEDPQFGDGMVGNLEVKVPLVDVKLEGRFGKINAGKEDAYSYWYLFGDVQKDMKKKIPLVKAGAYFSLWGFNGGAYYHMRDANPSALTAAERYLPDDKISLGLKAGITFSVTEPNVLWAKTTFGIQFKDDYTLDKISLDGDAYMLQAEPKETEGYEVDGIKAALYAAINVKKIDDKTEVEFNADLDIYANIADGLLVGNMDSLRTNLVVESTAHVDSEKWSFYMGTPSAPGSVQVGIPDLATITAKAYLMGGKGVEFDDAPLHPFIEGLLYGSSSKLRGSKATGNEITRTTGDGFAMGINVDYNLDIKASILYAEFRAMFGFDLSMLQQPGVTCANNGGADLGIGGYYATGQVFAGFRGDCGLDVDLWFYEGKVSLAEVYAAMMLRGGLPNPIWAEGRATMGFSVLGGLLKGDVDFDVEIGEKCDKEVANPFSGQSFIADVDPGNNAKNVNVYVNPRVSFENKLGKYEIMTPPDKDGYRKMRTFDVRLESTQLKKSSGSSSVSLTSEIASDKLSVLFRTRDILSEYTNYKFTTTVGIYELINGSYQKLMDNGKHVTESRTVQFKTGEKPDYLSINNIKLLYPHNGEKYYLKDENYYQECYMQLDKAQSDLWKSTTPAGKEWHTKVVARVYRQNWWRQKELVHEAPIKLATYGRLVYFSLPSNKLKNSNTYLIEVIRVPYRNSQYKTSGTDIADVSVDSYKYIKEGKTYQNYTSKSPPSKVVFSYKFSVSKYNSFEDKLKGETFTNEKRNPADYKDGNGVEYIIANEEPFSAEELLHRHLTFNQRAYGGIMRVEEQYDKSTNHPYYNLLYMLDMSKKASKYMRSLSTNKSFKYDWEKKWRFNSEDVYDGLKYDDQMVSGMISTIYYDRGDARFWYNTLDIIGNEDLNLFGINLHILHTGYNIHEMFLPYLFIYKNEFKNFESNGTNYLLSKPDNAKKYEVKLSYYPPYLSRNSGYIKIYNAGTVIKKY